MHASLIAAHPDERAVLALVLQRAGLVVKASHALEQALEDWEEGASNLVLMATSSAPLREVRQIRDRTETPLALIMDPSAEADQCALLELGADLVVSRPFSVRLLIAQVRALLRRAPGAVLQEVPVLSVAGLSLDPSARTAEVPPRPPQHLTHLEFQLLHTLMVHRGQTLPTEVLVERVWGYSGRGDRMLVRGLVSRLRAKIEPDAHHPRYILTQPGVGYCFDPRGDG